jgi:hypothetical protein
MNSLDISGEFFSSSRRHSRIPDLIGNPYLANWIPAGVYPARRGENDVE